MFDNCLVYTRNVSETEKKKLDHRDRVGGFFFLLSALHNMPIRFFFTDFAYKHYALLISTEI